MFYSQSTHPIPFSTFKNIKVKFAKVQKCKSFWENVQMKRVFVDANIVIDLLCERYPWFPKVLRIFSMGD